MAPDVKACRALLLHECRYLEGSGEAYIDADDAAELTLRLMYASAKEGYKHGHGWSPSAALAAAQRHPNSNAT